MKNKRLVRILEIDGGGIRGIYSMQFLQRFCEMAGIGRITDYFDVICGTSIGGICTLGLALGKSPEDLKNLLIGKGRDIFYYYSNVPSRDYGPVGTATMGAAVFLPTHNPWVYNNNYVYKFPYSGDRPLFNILKEVMGEKRLSDINTPVVITSVKYKGGSSGSDTVYLDSSNIYFPYPASKITEVNPVLFSNMNLPIFEGQTRLCTDVGLATSAAPYYFLPVQMSEESDPVKDYWYMDGGVFTNNPVQWGYTLGQILYPNAQKYSVLSIGTGMTNIGFNITPMAGTPQLGRNPEVDAEWADKLEMLPQLLGIAIGTGAEGSAATSMLSSLYQPMNLISYRFNSQLMDKQMWPMDNVSNNFPNGLISAANEQFEKDSVKISLFIQNNNF